MFITVKPRADDWVLNILLTLNYHN